MQSQEGERTWIARELHEDLGQRLAGLTMQLHSLSRVSIDDSLRTRVGDLCAQFGDLGRDIQAISYRLYSYKLEYLGLAAAVGAMCQEAARQHAVAIDFSHDGVPHDLRARSPSACSTCSSKPSTTQYSTRERGTLPSTCADARRLARVVRPPTEFS